MARKKSTGMPTMTEHKQWEAQDDLRTLERAEEIRKSSARMRAAQTEAKRQMAALGKVAGPAKKKAAPKRKATVRTRAKARKRT